MINPSNKLNLANNALRNGDFLKAIQLYRDLLKSQDKLLGKHILFNLDLAFSRLGLDHQLDNPVPKNIVQNIINTDIQTIAIYLPQFHAIPENDKWWGKGFTEWSNVRRARPQYTNHWQPHEPHQDIGYYDLTDPNVLERQVALAKNAGITGFCFYYYWFNGRRLLNMPTDRLLETGKPNFPFCFCWANENWTRAWDGGEKEILLGQTYSPESDERFIRDLIPAFRDERYIRIEGKPLLVVYRPGQLPNSKRTTEIWREICRREGIGDIYLARMQMFDWEIQSKESGFDVVIQFPPVSRQSSPDLTKFQELSDPNLFVGQVFDYRFAILHYLSEEINENLWPGVSPSWDNTARRMERGHSWINSSPENFRMWVHNAAHILRSSLPQGQRFLFVNAWNEWAEGCHLEPDKKFGYAWLNALKQGLIDTTTPTFLSKLNIVKDNLPLAQSVKPNISVVIPNYNHQKFLKERILSVLNQTFPPSEIIFLDDASNDQSVELAEAILSKSRIPYKILRNKKNSGGVFHQWLKGIDNSNYDLIWIAESDDSADKDFLLHVVKKFSREDVLASVGLISYIDESGNPSPDLDNYWNGLRDFSCSEDLIISSFNAFTHDFAIKNVIPNASGLLFRKPKLTEVERSRLIEYKFSGDWYFYLLITRGGSIAFSPKAKSYFRMRAASTSRALFSGDQHLKEHKMILADIALQYPLDLSVIQKHAENLLVLFPQQTQNSILKLLTADCAGGAARPFRVAIATHSFEVGGGEVVPLELANLLKNHGHHVIFLVLVRSTKNKDGGIRGRLRPDIPVFYATDISDFDAFFVDYGTQIINSHNVSWDYHFANHNITLRIPYVASLHGGYETVPHLLDQVHFLNFISKIDTWLYLTAKNISLLHQKGILRGNAKKIFNAVPNDQRDLSRENTFRYRHLIDKNKFVAVICSRAIEEKGWDICLEVLRHAQADNFDALHIVFIGDGPYFEEAKKLASDLSNVTFCGYLENPKQYFSAFDVGLFPSRYAGESFPLFILECLVTGLPVIASNIGEISRMIDEGRAGCLIPSGVTREEMVELIYQSIKRLYNDPELLKRTKLIAKSQAARFSADSLCQKYVEIFSSSINNDLPSVKSSPTGPLVIAIHLPQFHPFKENDEWWGQGFTEWTNVRKSKSLFEGHMQPRSPTTLGYYDLRSEEARRAQASLAKKYGVDAFCYYHYWFKGHRLMKEPIDAILSKEEADIPFMFCWANETWSRRWLGEDQEILIKQEYSESDNLEHVDFLIKAFSHKSYLKIDGRPIFVIYRPTDIPSLAHFLKVLREICIRALGSNPLVLGSSSHAEGVDMRDLGMDGTLDFQPKLGFLEGAFDDGNESERLARNRQLGIDLSTPRLYDARDFRTKLKLSRASLKYPVVPSVYVGWDNSPRRGANGIVLLEDSPMLFTEALEDAYQYMQTNPNIQFRALFINAWNEWAEGNYLEPDNINGFQYLNALKLFADGASSDAVFPRK